MGQNKEQKITNKEIQQPAKEAENTIDFSKFSLWNENLEQSNTPNPIWQWLENQTNESQNIPIQVPQEQTETKNLIAELNNMQEEKQQDVHIEDIVIQENKLSEKENPVLWNSGISKKAIKHKTNTRIEETMISYIIIGISALAMVLTGLYSKYVSSSVSTTPTNQTFTEKVKSFTKTISKHTNINDYAAQSERTDILTNDHAEKTAKDLIQNKDLNYLHKKDILEKNMQILIQYTIQNAQTLDNIKKEIVKYWFIPQQLHNIIETKQWTNWIKTRISLMENIRLITAFKAFSYMESFVQWLTNNLGKDPLLIENKLKKVIVDWENDIIIYTNTCFLNPYEINSNCTTIWDFDNYYKIIDTQREVDTEFIKQLATYIDNKLQETDIPTFSITFQKFNPKEEKIDFVIDLNTHSQDEIALNKQWILNPHVFIATNIINLLKQSLLVIWEDIKADQIKTSPKTIRVWSTIFTVNNSSIKLSLPIQKSIQREISDFFSSKY